MDQSSEVYRTVSKKNIPYIPLAVIGIFVLIIIAAILGIRMFSGKSSNDSDITKGAVENDRNTQLKYYPYDPESPMVKTLLLHYTIAGVFNKFEETEEDKGFIYLSSTTDQASFKIPINFNNNPIITDKANKPVELEKINPGTTMTVTLLVNKKSNEQQIQFISVNQ